LVRPPVGDVPNLGEAPHFLRSMVTRPTKVFYCEKIDVNTTEMSCKVAATGFRGANGITANTDMSEVYIADTFSNSINVYTRNSADNTLHLLQTLNIGHSIDNLKFDHETKSIIAGSMYSFAKSSKLDKLYP